ncbi:hypothetical protein FA15DRAFT_702475 [Coprinopsis marcescibilis]|uniref:F-box domain-containing protein n=1 Tax=Coprinopsis marcescibilis TaxID=230819 RepID=A0A5C3L434_COPMA|nr:hypothetical protein FA15DRAFT_702475 [Coprinopsis marcescibilis]
MSSFLIESQASPPAGSVVELSASDSQDNLTSPFNTGSQLGRKHANISSATDVQEHFNVVAGVIKVHFERHSNVFDGNRFAKIKNLWDIMEKESYRMRAIEIGGHFGTEDLPKSKYSAPLMEQLIIDGVLLKMPPRLDLFRKGNSPLQKLYIRNFDITWGSPLLRSSALVSLQLVSSDHYRPWDFRAPPTATEFLDVFKSLPKLEQLVLTNMGLPTPNGMPRDHTLCQFPHMKTLELNGKLEEVGAVLGCFSIPPSAKLVLRCYVNYHQDDMVVPVAKRFREALASGWLSAPLSTPSDKDSKQKQAIQALKLKGKVTTRKIIGLNVSRIKMSAWLAPVNIWGEDDSVPVPNLVIKIKHVYVQDSPVNANLSILPLDNLQDMSLNFSDGDMLEVMGNLPKLQRLHLDSSVGSHFIEHLFSKLNQGQAMGYGNLEDIDVIVYSHDFHDGLTEDNLDEEELEEEAFWVQ